MKLTKKSVVLKDIRKKITKTQKHKQTHKLTRNTQYNAKNTTFNDICDLYEEGHEPLNEDTHIFSASLFKLNDMYRDIKVYIDGLQFLINYLDELITKHNQNIHFFLYYDNSIETDKKFIEIKSYLLNKSFIKLIKYNCPKFMLGDMHKGLFGTLVRMFPLFDIKYEKNIKSVIDIDVDNENINSILFRHKQILTNKNDIIISVSIGYEWAYKNFIKPKYFDGCVVANITFNKISLDSNLLKDILNKINKGDNKILDIFTKIIKLRLAENKKWRGFNDASKINAKNLFIYGIDEYFINLILFDYLIEHNKKIGIIYRPDFGIYKYISFITKWDNYDANIIKQFFKEFLKHKYNYKDSIKQCINKGRNLIVINNVKNKTEYDIQMNNLERFYNLIQKYSNKIKFDNDYIKNIELTIKNKNNLFIYNGILTKGKIKDYRPQKQRLQ